MQDGTTSPKPPDQEAIALRALCLGALITRAQFGLVIKSNLDRTTRTIHEKMLMGLEEWLRSQKLESRFSEQERELFGKPLSAWSHQDFADAMRRAESLGVLLWAVSILDRMPPYHAPFSESEVLRPLGIFSAADKFLARVQLRSSMEISAARDLAEEWSSRSRTKLSGQHSSEPPSALTLDQITLVTAQDAYQQTGLSKVIREEHSIFGKATRGKTKEGEARTASITRERYRALNWLCGYQDWDGAPPHRPSRGRAL